jgi:sugar phosphate permease
MIIPLMAADLFGVRVLGRAMGIVLAADGIAEATAPMLIGHMRDTSGSYTTGFLVIIAFAIAGALAIALLPRRRAAEHETETPLASPVPSLETPESIRVH